MAMSTSSGSADYGLFDELAEEFAERYRRGERPSLQEFVDRCPEMGDEIRELFPALVEVEQAEEVLDGSAGRMASPPTTPLRQVGDYRVIREVGRGGMGVVYEAEQVSLGRRVALKILPVAVAKDRKTLERFRREARAAARLHHTNIVPVFEVGRDGEVVFYAMQFIQGQGLDAVIEELTRQQQKSGHGSAAPIAAGAGEEPLVPVGTTRPTPAGALSRSPASLSVRDRTEALAASVRARQVRRMARSLVTGSFADEQADPDRTGSSGGWTATDPCDSQPRDPTGWSSPASSSTSAVLPGGTQVSAVESLGKRLPFFRSVAQIGRQAAQGLAYAHARGIIHRDVKPSNLLLDSAGVVWIADFGLAKADDDGLTATGDILGTLRYMAPERFRGEGDPRADVYALGLTLYELLTLRPGFESSDRLQMIERIKTEEPPRPRTVDSRIPRDLETIVLKAIEKDTERRYPTADAMAEDLRRYLDDEPVLARRTTALERYARWARRNPGIAILGAVLTVVLLLVTAGSLLVARRFARLFQSEQVALSLVESERGKVVASLEKAEAAGKEAREAERLARTAEESGRKLLYTTDMKLVPFMWKDPQATAAQIRSRLNAHDPRQNPSLAGKDDLRGFEWHYHHHLLERSASVFSGHGAPVLASAFPSDGQLLTLDQNGQLRRWDLNLQREYEASRRDLPWGSNNAPFLALSPGGRLAALAEGNTVHVFDTSTGKETFSIDSPDVIGINGNNPRRLIFSRQGDWLVIVDDKIRWLSTASGEAIASLDQRFVRTEDLALSADGLTLAVVGHGAFSYEFSVFRLNGSTRTVRPSAKGAYLGAGMKASALSPDGQQIAVGSSSSGRLFVFDTATGRSIALHGSAHASPISAIAFSGDGLKLATGDTEGTIKVWADAQELNAKSAALLTLKGHQGAINSVGFSSDGERLVSTSVDKTARVWDLENDGAAIRPLERSGDPCYAARFSPDGHLIAAAADRGLRLWDAASGRLVRELSAGGLGRVQAVAFSPTAHRLLAVGLGGEADVSHVALWDIDAGMELPRLSGATDQPGFWVGDDTGAVGALAFSPQGKYLVAGFGTRRWTPSPHDDPNPLRVWDLVTRRLIHRLNGHTDYCLSLGFSRDGTLLASGGRDGTAILWSTANWEAARTLQNPDKNSFERAVRPGMVEDVAFSPDGETLAMASREGNIQLWDVGTGRLIETLRGHSSVVNAVAFSPDGRTLASGSTDQTVRLWNVETRRELMQLDPGKIDLGPVRILVFSPDGKKLLAGGRSAAFWYAEPIVWNDPDRAAEKLRLLLLSNGDFASRIRMLSENLRLHEALAKLDAKEVRVQAALAAAQANWHASRREWPEAVAGFDRLMAADPTAPEAWLRTPGLLRLATALVHQDRPADAAMLVQGGAKRRTQDGLPAVDQVEAGFAYAAADGTVRVTELLPGCSGSRADLVAGDTLLKVNDTELTSETVPRLGELLAGEAGTKVRLTVRHAGSEKPQVIELTRERLLSDPATGELLHPLRSAVHSRLARNPRDTGLLELRAELAGQWSDWNAQVADFTAVIQILSAQPTEEFSARMRRLYRARGDAYMRLQRWRAAADDYAHLVTPETKDVELLSSRARAHEALKNWDAAAADWSRVATGNPEGAGLLAEFARRLAAGGQVPRAKGQFEKSQTLYEQSLEVDPENEVAAAELAQVLLDKERNENATQWADLRPVEAKSVLGTTLSILPDDSILASGANPLKERYCVELTVGTAIDLAAVRLEALTHPSLPGSGPGRNPSGAFSQTSWSVTATSPDRVEPIKVEFDTAWADHQSEWGPIKADGQWDIWGGQGGNCTAIWSMAKSISLAPGTKLAFEMQYTGSEIRGNLGRFRLSVSGDQAVFARERTRLAARKLADPWSRLAAAYQVIGDHQALDKLLDRHPAAAAGVGDLYGAAQDWERAIAEYHKTLTDQPSNRDLFNKLATAYQSAGRTREAVRCLAKIHIANPQDSVLLLKLASLQAWFQQDSEWADTCRRALTSAGEVKLPQVAQKMAKACCLLPSVNKAQVEAALALARKAVELGKTSPWLAWFQMALGMAEYRSGRFAEADARLLAAANGGISSPSVVLTAAFYRALSLYRQGKENEARQLATEAAVKMKPLPKDEANPLAGGKDADDLILWLAYKEAKAMIKFDAAPAAPATPVGK